jgi:hypothetical protein
MNFVSKAALGVAIALGGLSLTVATPAAAQGQKAPALKLSKEERAALVPIENALKASDAAAAATALAAARPQMQGADARYAFGSMQVRLGLLNKDQKMQLEGLDLMTSSGSSALTDAPSLLRNQLGLAFGLKDYARAEAAATRLIALTPNDANAIKDLGLVRIEQNRVPEGLGLLDKAIGLRKAANQPVEENWYKFAFNTARKARMVPQAVKFSRDWLASYPSATNWRDTLTIYRSMTQPDRAMLVDIYRLLRAQKALNGESDYYVLANALQQTGYPGEVKSVLDEAFAAGISQSKPEFADLRSNSNRQIGEDKASLPAQEKSALGAGTGSAALKVADAYFGYGEYAKAATLYRAALTKGGVDANLVNTRLGMALALAGNKAEAEAAFKAVGGARADLAGYLLLWLQQRSA